MNSKLILKWVKNTKQLPLAAAALFACGLLLMLLPANENSTADAAQTDSIDVQEYALSMEKRLTKLLSAIDGAGAVQVMVTVEAAESYEYAADAMQSSGYNEGPDTVQEESIFERSTIIVDGRGGDEPILITKYLPKIMGVAVICEGGDNIYVKQSMIEAVSILCGISSNKISISKMTSATA